jgi:hypothetical protein
MRLVPLPSRRRYGGSERCGTARLRFGREAKRAANQQHSGLADPGVIDPGVVKEERENSAG